VEDCACHVCDCGLEGKPDADQLNYAAGLGAVFVTSDKRIKNPKHERAALLSAGVSVLEVSFPDSYSLWGRFKMLVNQWEAAACLLAQGSGQVYVIVRPRSVRTLGDEERRQARHRRA
jgi:hypothetical protein